MVIYVYIWRLNLDLKSNNNYINLFRIIMYAVFIGLLGNLFAVFVLLFYPVIFMESSIKNGIVPTMGAMAVSSGIIALVAGPLAVLSLFFVIAPMILTFHYCVVNMKSYGKTFLYMFLVLLVSFVSYNYGLLRTNPVDIESLIDTLLAIQVDNLNGALSGMELEEYERTLRSLYEYSLRLAPSILLVGISIFTYVNYLLTGRRLLKQGIFINQPPAFKNLQIPRFMILVFGIAILIILILRYLGLEYYSNIYLNTLVVFVFIFFVNGLALFSNFFLRFRIPSIIRTFIYISALFFPSFGFTTLVLGLIDTLINFRRIRLKRE